MNKLVLDIASTTGVCWNNQAQHFCFRLENMENTRDSWYHHGLGTDLFETCNPDLIIIEESWKGFGKNPLDLMSQTAVNVCQELWPQAKIVRCNSSAWQNKIAQKLGCQSLVDFKNNLRKADQNFQEGCYHLYASLEKKNLLYHIPEEYLNIKNGDKKTKLMSYIYCLTCGYEPPTEDEADAYCIWSIGEEIKGYGETKKEKRENRKLSIIEKARQKANGIIDEIKGVEKYFEIKLYAKPEAILKGVVFHQTIGAEPLKANAIKARDKFWKILKGDNNE